MLSINVRTSVPVSPWESSNVTLLGDSIHTMTPGRGAGANTALRDAALPLNKLKAIRCWIKERLSEPEMSFEDRESAALATPLRHVLHCKLTLDLPSN